MLERAVQPCSPDSRLQPPQKAQWSSLSQRARQVLEGLPASLKLQLTLVMHAPAFVKLPLFHLFSPAETLAVAQRLQPVSQG